MSKYVCLSQAALSVALAAGMMSGSYAAEQVNLAACQTCHAQVSQFHQSGDHKKVPCTTCHSGLDKHLKAPGKDTRPVTNNDPRVCGTCHKYQMETMYKVNPEITPRDSKKNSNNIAPDPFFDRAMGYHGFTKEHDLPRSHTFMVLDQFVVDRAFGGRFVPKDGWLYLTQDKGPINAWDFLKDTQPDTNTQKPLHPWTAAAANPVCLSCKTTDLMLGWAYLGEDKPGVDFSRKSSVVDMARKANHAINCNFCHDPHSTKPRLVRDGLIDALTRTDFPTVYSQDENHTKIDVKDMGVRGFTRKVAFLEKTDSNLMCAQCHTEYNCNPGVDTKTGKPITMADPRTNLVPLVKVDKINEFYQHVNFKDFKHPITGALLTKMQHPDYETYMGSTHAKMGIQCAACHMPKVKVNGKVQTMHWATSPTHYMKETCLSCHKDKTAAQMTTVIDGMHAYYLGKMRETESRMNEMFNAFEMAQAAGVSNDVLDQARKLHDVAHSNWEWWTAVNGAWFHNPDEARASMAKAANAAIQATNLLNKAIAEKNAAKVAAAK